MIYISSFTLKQAFRVTLKAAKYTHLPTIQRYKESGAETACLYTNVSPFQAVLVSI